MVFSPIHHLPLLEQKAGALECAIEGAIGSSPMANAAPLAGWDLPDEFATLRRLMEARMIKAGRREYVQVLRLLETFERGDLHVAIKNALRMGAIGFGEFAMWPPSVRGPWRTPDPAHQSIRS